MKNIIGRIMCFIGIHIYTCSIHDCVEEFGFVPKDGRMPKNSKCKRCGTSYN